MSPLVIFSFRKHLYISKQWGQAGVQFTVSPLFPVSLKSMRWLFLFSSDLLLPPPGYPRHTCISDELVCVSKHWQSLFKCMLGLLFLPLELLILALLWFLGVSSQDNIRHNVCPQTRATGSRGHIGHHNQLMAKFSGSPVIKRMLNVCGSLQVGLLAPC